MDITREEVIELLNSIEVPHTKKGKPLSNDALATLLVAKRNKLINDDEEAIDDVAESLLNAMDEDEEINVTGADPMNKKAEKAAPGKKERKAAPPVKSKKAKPPVEDDEEDEEEEDEEDEEEDDDEEETPPPKKSKKAEKAKKAAAGKAAKNGKPAKSEKAPKKEKGIRDAWGSSPNSSAGRINVVFFSNKKKKLTVDEIVELLDDESCTKQRVRDHLRRLHLKSELLEKDAKNRYFIAATPAKDE